MQINQGKKRNQISNKSHFDNLTQTVPQNTSFIVPDNSQYQTEHDL